MTEIWTTVGIVCGVGATFLVICFVFFCFRRRIFNRYSNCYEADVKVAKSRSGSICLTNIDQNSDVEYVGYYEITDRNWFEGWTSHHHRADSSTLEIIRKVFGVSRDSPTLGQSLIENKSKGGNKSTYIAIPARMTQPLREADLSKGQFSGDTEEHFKPIYRQSKIMTHRLSGSQPVSPHYLSTEVLRSSHSPIKYTTNPLRQCCGEVQSPDDVHSTPAPADKGSNKGTQNPLSPRKQVTSLSSITSNTLQTSMEAHTEGTLSPTNLEPPPEPVHTAQHIYTIHETCSSISSDSLTIQSNYGSEFKKHTSINGHLQEQEKHNGDTRHAQYSPGVKTDEYRTSPKLADPTYHGFLQSARLEHI